MKKFNRISLVFCSLFLASCVMVQPYFPQQNLNRISIGWTKDQFFNWWGDGKSCATFMISYACDTPSVRAAQVGSDKVLTEVVTLNMATSDSCCVGVEFWFLFRGNQLVQWGKPEDWQKVSGRYEISFSPGVRQ
jgi:hypothetical protein